MDIDQNDQGNILEQLSVQDFLDVGLNQVAYIRRHTASQQDDGHSYAIYAADGSQISVMNSLDTAMAAIRINDLFAVTLH